ncbi:MAG TPA: GNAT family protein [Streptosporangiaceae bacterium]
MDCLAELWPVFGLLIQTPRLRLRLPREDDLCELARSARIIAGPGEPQLHLPWMYQPSPDMERQFLQRYWRALAHWKPESWHLPLAIYLDGQPIGIQDMWASDFARLRSVGTGSWVTRSEQGHGYGTEARLAVLELAFGHLGAQEACTEYLDGNHASEKVSRKLGYTGNGQHLVYRDDTGRTTEYRLRLDRRTWHENRDGTTAIITGLTPCLAMFGLAWERDQEH